MTEKYYTPQIEEIHIGMEFEEEFKNYNHKKMVRPVEDKWEWVKLKLDTSHSMSRIISKIKQSRVRVKYLDKTDLIDLGWIKDGSTFKIIEGYYDEEDDITGFEYTLTFYTERLFITKNTVSYGKVDIPYEGDNYVFKGQVKNKTEMKKLMKMLNIKPLKTN